jgi:hypothetical protein
MEKPPRKVIGRGACGDPPWSPGPSALQSGPASSTPRCGLLARCPAGGTLPNLNRVLKRLLVLRSLGRVSATVGTKVP